MKRLFLFLLVITVIGACNSGKSINESFGEGFQARPISEDSAMIYRKNFESDRKFRQTFRKGMMIPAEVLKTIYDQGVDEIYVYYGKSPDFRTPVFIVYGASSKMKYKASTSGNTPPRVTYMVYYPCPPNCVGK